jgi:hypothetical protein
MDRDSADNPLVPSQDGIPKTASAPAGAVSIVVAEHTHGAPRAIVRPPGESPTCWGFTPRPIGGMMLGRVNYRRG